MSLVPEEVADAEDLDIILYRSTDQYDALSEFLLVFSLSLQKFFCKSSSPIFERFYGLNLVEQLEENSVVS